MVNGQGGWGMQILQILSTLKIPRDTDLTQHTGVIDPEYTQYANEPVPHTRSGVDLCKLLDVNTDSHTL